MTIKEDLLRALSYGKDPYAEAIREMPSFKAELERTSKNYQERSWIDVKGFIPKFTTDEFNKRKDQYQAKYGDSVNVPGFADVIHLTPPVNISTQEMAEHNFAKKRGLPSPLNPDQIQTLARKKYRFLKALSSPAPTWLRTYGAVATAADNIEDALITLYWTGRLAVSVAPRLLGRVTPVFGWLLLGSDVLNAGNLIATIGALRRGCKGLHGEMNDRNPFSTKAKAERTSRLQKKTPGFGALLEILQTTDQLFGVGLCLGGLMGMVQDAALKMTDPGYWSNLWSVIYSGDVNQISDWASKSAVNDYGAVKKGLQDQYSQFKDEAYRLKAMDQKVREGTYNYIRNKAKETWDWIKTIPETSSQFYYDPLIGSMIISTGEQEFEKDQHTKAFMFLNQAMNGVMPWWYENDPIKNMKEIMNWKWRAPEPKRPDTIDVLQESIHDWKTTVKWPHIEKREATFEEIGFEYSRRIKESFQAYCLNYQHEYKAMVAAYECTDFVKNVIRSYDDNHEVRTGMTAYLAAAIDMIDQGQMIPPETSQDKTDAIAQYINEHERKTGNPPKIHDIVTRGKRLGIQWTNQVPEKIPESAENLFPGWRAIQDQVGELHIAD